MAIYLDHHATTPVDPRVLEAMLPYLKERFGNASSRSHRYGWEAEEAVERARRQVADLIGADPREIVFTSGATEANNLALLGAAARAGAGRRHLVVSPLEHPSVRETALHLHERGFEVAWLRVDAAGRVDPAEVERAITDRTFLVSVMAANNEVGTVQPVDRIGAICRARGILFHTDASQAVAKVPFRVDQVDLAVLTGHKIYGPKGCGALYVRRKNPSVELERQVHGGGQERGLRPGTLNVAGIVGLGMACEIGRMELEKDAAHDARLRDRLWNRLARGFDGLVVHGSTQHRLPGNLHVAFPGLDSQSLMLAVPEVAVSSGSACASGSLEPSHVLQAMGVPPERARASVRFGVGRFNTEEEIDRAAELFLAAAKRLAAVARR